MVINSLLDNDFYKFTMMHAVMQHYPEAQVRYQFTNRTLSDTFSLDFFDRLTKRIKDLESLTLTEEEYSWFKSLNLLPTPFLDTLRNFRFNSNYINAYVDLHNQLVLDIQGPWHETILFEVPLLALITETYYESHPLDLDKYRQLTLEKGQALSNADCHFTDFGTRRRHSYKIQELVVDTFTNHLGSNSTYLGTSNVDLSRRYGTLPVGTMAHEWIMAHGGLFGVQQANAKALDTWLDVYNGDFSIALTDTYTTDAFFQQFTPDQAKIFSGIRQDSGSPLEFTDKALAFYGQQGIDPKSKRIVYSDSLTYKKAIEIEKYINKRAQSLYGIGTHFTNDRSPSRTLNIVIKLQSINNIPVYKTTDTPSKASPL